MSALTLPRTATAPSPAAVAPVPSEPPATANPAPDRGRPDLRLVETPPRPSLAPTGPLQAWRRRLGVLLVLAALVGLAVQTIADAPVAAPEVAPVSATTVVVQPGQTLWDVAEEHAPADVGPAAYVRELAELNGVTNGALEAWQVLRLPAA